MASIQSANLAKTLKYLSKNGRQFKYEIYQSSDGTHIFAIVYMLVELMTGSGMWVWTVEDEEVVLLGGGQHPEFADSEARKHFDENYINE